MVRRPGLPRAEGGAEHGREGRSVHQREQAPRAPRVIKKLLPEGRNFVVVWQENLSFGPDTCVFSVQGQRYGESGATIDGPFEVATASSGVQTVTVAAASSGVLAPPPLGSPPPVFVHPPGVISFCAGAAPRVANDSDGDFVVVWDSAESVGSDTSGLSVQGQRYDAAGAPIGGAFQVNTYTTGDQQSPSVASDSKGKNLVVVWQSDGSVGNDTSGTSVQGRRLRERRQRPQ